MCWFSAAWRRKRQDSELTAVLKPDPRLLWDQFDHTASTKDGRPPDDLAEAKEDHTEPHRNQSFPAFTVKASHLKCFTI